MKNYKIVIFVLLFAFFLQIDAKKVCILHEQNIPPIATILSEGIIALKEAVLNVNEAISEVVEETISAAQEELLTEEVITEEVLTENVLKKEVPEEVLPNEILTQNLLAEEVLTEKISEVTENVSKLADISVIPNDGEIKSPNVCALEAITFFDDQNVSKFN